MKLPVRLAGRAAVLVGRGSAFFSLLGAGWLLPPSEAQAQLRQVPSLQPAEQTEILPVPELRPRTPAEPDAEAPTEPRLVEDDWLLVVAEDSLAAGAILNIGQAAVGVGQREWFFGRTLRQSVIVRLIRAAPAGPEDAPYRVRAPANGPVSLALRWHAEAPFDDVVQGVAHALLVASLRERSEGQAPEPLPWLVHAFALQVQVALQPLRRQWFARQALAQGVPAVRSIWEAETYFGEDRQGRALSSYWLLRCVRAEAVSREWYSAFLQGLLREGGGVEALNGLRAEAISDDQARELWWAVSFQAEVRARLGPVLPMEDSRRLLERLSLLRAFVAEAEREFAPEDLWLVRDDPKVRQAVAQRVREVKVEVPVINPVYHNALLSLGALYEALLQEDAEAAAYAEALALWQGEKLQAGRLQADVMQALHRRVR